MSVTTISNTSSSALSGSDSASLIPQKTLDQEDFFKLLIAQMTSQDPMKPLSNAEFMGQMAQFSTLEQTRSLESQVAQMRSQQGILQANDLIGREIYLKTSTGSLHGTVSGVEIQDGTPKLVIDGGTYDLDQIVTIAPSTPAQI